MTKENNKNIYLYNDLSNLKLEESKSEHKKKENDIFKLLIENIKEYAIFMLDTNGYIITWNSGAKRLKYYNEDEIIGKHFSIFYTKEDIKNNKPEKKLKDAIEFGKVEDEYWRIRKDGSKFWANVVITSVYDNNNLIGFAKITRDLTERKITEEKVISAYEESSRLKSLFLANMSHEMRTPMNGIISAASLLMKTESKIDKDLIDIIYQSGKNLLKIINDILDYSKIEANKLKFINEDFEIREIINKIIIIYKLTNEKNIKFIINISNNVPKIVNGDPLRFNQVLLILIDNAVKFTEKGSITINIDKLNEIDNNIKLYIEVIDTGIGISRHDINNLFKPFIQVDSSSTKKYKGTGLGLSICKKLVEMMNGNIYVESQIDVGSKFWCTLELYNSNKLNIQKERKVIYCKESNLNIRILVVEDNVINQKVLIKILNKLGYKLVDSVFNGEEAVNIFKNQAYDLILMDIHMPVMDGYEATKQIRKRDEYIPIIAVSANLIDENISKCYDSGIDDYIMKPIDIVQLSQIINIHLKKIEFNLYNKIDDQRK